MMLGLNHKVGRGGLTFHAQTEIVSERDDVHRVVSSLYFRGCVVCSHQCHYKVRCGGDTTRELCKLIRRQHRLLLLDLDHGRFDEQIAATPGTGEFAAVSCGPAESPPHAADHFADGMRALRRGDYDGAYREWLAAAEMEPQNKVFHAHLRLVERFIEDEDRRAAESHNATKLWS